MHKTDPNYDKTMASKNTHGVVGENAIWDGPLDQTGRHLRLKVITTESQ
jgi:hypothetical protein